MGKYYKLIQHSFNKNLVIFIYCMYISVKQDLFKF